MVDGKTNDVLLRGGVCNNSYFVERLKANLEVKLGKSIDRIETLEDLGLDWENFVPSCISTRQPVVGGRIAPGENFHSTR